MRGGNRPTNRQTPAHAVAWQFVNYLPVLLVIASVTLYNVALKFTPKDLNPLLMVAVAYAIGIVLCVVGSFVLPGLRIDGRSFSPLNWTVIALAVAVMGIELGFLLAYRSGWPVSTTPIVIHISATVILTLIATTFWKESLGWQQVLGLVLCGAGLVLVVR
jgi:drug/metabolite transporter (DMT)-like permease